MGIIAFSLGEFPLYWYGLLVSFTILLGWSVTKVNLYVRRERMDCLPDVLLCGIIGGIAGARLGYVCLHFSGQRWTFHEILAVTHGGISIYGAFIGFTCFLALYTYLRNLRFWHCLDILTPAFLLGLAIMQLGHFALQITVGLPVSGSEAAGSRIIEYIEYFFRPAGYEGYEYFRPVALYQAMWQFAVFCFAGMLSFTSLYRRMHEGNLFLLSLLLICLGRFCLGFFYLGTGSGLSLGQVICAIAAAGCFVVLAKNKFVFRRKVKRSIFH